MKGIILAGGKGTRMLPATRVTNKHMLPILNVPMITYPLETLKNFGCKEILVISGGDHIGDIAEYLGDGSEFEVDLTYKVQKDAGGISQALGLAEAFSEGFPVLVVLGDNIFDNTQFGLSKLDSDGVLASLFIKEVDHPERFGVISQVEGKYKIIEKPKEDLGRSAVTGLYYFPSDVFSVIKTLKPSDRGELEVTDLNNYYIENDRFILNQCDGFWSDAGTPESMLEVVKWISEKK